MNKKLVLLSLVGIFLLTVLSTANATATSYGQKLSAVGAGVFIHNHDGVPHTHYFVFAVSQDSPKSSPQGTFDLVCQHDGTIDTVIISTKITSLTVQPVTGGLKAVFTGVALVKMGSAGFEKGWMFTITAIDMNGQDSIGVVLANPQGMVMCSADPTPLTSGNIVIKTSR